ncbi:MAG: DUF885 domain-containing protein [Asgard group archaeon]|nr:DUF885 domain-containing protein [Asgard group archaeon]
MIDENRKLYDLFFKQFEEEMENSPIMATWYGYKHEKYDYLLPDESLRGYEEKIERYMRNKREITTRINYEKLSNAGKLDYEVVINFYELLLFNLNELALWRSGAPGQGPISTAGKALYLLFTRDFAPLENRVQAMIERLKLIPEFLENSKNLWQFPVKLWTEMSIEEGKRTIDFFKLIEQSIREKIKEKQLQELSNAIEEANNAIVDYVEWIKNKVLPKANHNWSIGQQKFERFLELRKLGKTAGEILEIGEVILAKTKEDLEILAKELFPEKSISEVRELIKEDCPATFEEAITITKKYISEARTFIEKNDLADLQNNESIEVIPTPSFMIPIVPFAIHMPAEKFSKQFLGQYLITPIEDNPELLKEHCHAACKNKAVHEAYPGHHLQFVLSNSQENLIRSILFDHHFQPVAGAEALEGWAHYCEQYMAEKGFLGRKEIFIQLIEQIWRAVRIIVDVKIHTGKMTFEEAKEFMMKEIGMNETAVLAELKRYTTRPTYPLSYLLGKIMIIELREEIKQKMGDKYTDKFFHDIILSNGGLPIYFLRKLYYLRISKKEFSQ